MRYKFIASCFFIFSFAYTVAQSNDVDGFKGFDKIIPQKANKQFQSYFYFYQQNVAMNIYPENDFLKDKMNKKITCYEFISHDQR